MKRTFTCCLAIVALTWFTACTGNDKPADNTVADTTPEDSSAIETIDTVFSGEMITTFNTTAFSEYAKKNAPGFDWGRFNMTTSWTDDTLLTSSFNPGENFYSNYGPLLIYSPDSSMFIDLYSYTVDLKRDNTGKLKGGALGPDTEVSLVKPATGEKTRILFFGPNGSAEDALWLNNEEVVIMGVHDYNDDSTGKKTAVWRFNIPTKTTFLYELPNDTATAEKVMGYWRKEKLKGVLMQ